MKRTAVVIASQRRAKVVGRGRSPQILWPNPCLDCPLAVEAFFFFGVPLQVQGHCLTSLRSAIVSECQKQPAALTAQTAVPSTRLFVPGQTRRLIPRSYAAGAVPRSKAAIASLSSNTSSWVVQGPSSRAGEAASAGVGQALAPSVRPHTHTEEPLGCRRSARLVPRRDLMGEGRNFPDLLASARPSPPTLNMGSAEAAGLR